MNPEQKPEFSLNRAENGGESSVLREYWHLLIQRRWVVFACVGMSLVVAALYTFFSTPMYQAGTTLQIDRRVPDILAFKDVVGVDPSYGAYRDFYQTQYKILRSKTVIRIAVENLDLPNDPAFANRKPRPLRRLTGWLRSRIATPPPAPEDPLTPAVNMVRSRVTVSPVRNSHLVRVRYADSDPELARRISVAVADAYVQFNYQSMSGSTELATDFLTKEVLRLRDDIDALERQLQGRSAEKSILSLSEGTQDISEQALAALNQSYVEARSRLALAEARYHAVRGASPDAMPEVVNSPLIISLRQQHAVMHRTHSQMSERFKSDWPELAQFREELAQATDLLARESERIADQVRSAAEASYEQAQAEVTNLARQVDRQKNEVQRVNRDTIEVAGLRAEIETKRQVLSSLITRQSQTETTDRVKETRASNIRIVDKAETPRAPFKPNKKLHLLIGLMVGVGLGIGAAFLLDHLDNTIKNEQDLRRFGDLTVFGHLPLVQSLSVVGEKRGAPAASSQIDLASHLDSRSDFAEACRSIRTALLLASPDHPPRSIVVTSCEPSDGKSTAALNLSIVLAQLGRRVLLLDADLRRPRLHKVLGLSNATGLSSFLSGNAAQSDVIFDTEIPNIRVIPSGPIPPNPSELLDSVGLKSLLAEIHRDGLYDHIVIDSPPLLHVTDSVLLAAGADASIVVVRVGKTSRESITEGTRRLRMSRSRVIGAVLNAVPDESGYYYGRYRSYTRKPDADETGTGVHRRASSR